MSSRYAVLSDAQWEFIAPLMPDSSGKPGRPFNDHRLMTEGIIYRYRAGIPWRDLPSHFGSWKTVWKHHRRNSAARYLGQGAGCVVDPCRRGWVD